MFQGGANAPPPRPPPLKKPLLTEHDTGSMREVRGLQLGKDRYGYMIHRAWMTGKY